MHKMLLGMSAWDNHLDLFFKYGLPSLMSNGNLPKLAKHKQIIFNIHTNQHGYERLLNSNFPFLWYAKTDSNNENKYEQIGRHQNADLRAAKMNGADYHCLMPDFVYSENCFSGMLKAIERGHKAIARLNISACLEAISPELSPNMSAKELATLSLKYTHPGVRNWRATEKDYPNTHVLAWEGKDELRMCSPHCHPVYIANEAIKLSDSDKPLDCILDEVIDGEVYLTRPEDEMVIIELSPEYSRRIDDGRVDLKEFARIVKTNTKGSSKQIDIFKQETVDPINRSKLGNEYWNEVAINEQKRIVIQEIMEN